MIGFNNKYIEFVIQYSDITALPEYLRMCTNLQQLTIIGNNITCIPDWIGELTTLKNLHISEKNITKLPASINNLVNLTHLLVACSLTEFNRYSNI